MSVFQAKRIEKKQPTNIYSFNQKSIYDAMETNTIINEEENEEQLRERNRMAFEKDKARNALIKASMNKAKSITDQMVLN